jgi:hypothetical protein
MNIADLVNVVLTIGSSSGPGVPTPLTLIEPEEGFTTSTRITSGSALLPPEPVDELMAMETVAWFSRGL